MPPVNGAVVKITCNAALGREHHGMVDTCRTKALEQLESDGHPGWSVLEWEIGSLQTYLLAQVTYAAGWNAASERHSTV